MKRFILAASCALAVPAMVQAQVISTGSWVDLSGVTVNNNSADAYWDKSSSDGAACNVGYYLIGGFAGCNNLKPVGHALGGVGSLGSTGSFLGTSLMGDRNFSFSAGLYRVDFLANIAGYDPSAVPVGQELRAYIGGTTSYETVYLREDSNGPVYSFNLDASAGDWFFGAYAYGATMTGQSRYSNTPELNEWNRFSIFSAAGANDNPRNAGTWYVGFEDSYNGDRDFNDLIVRVSQVDGFEQVPEQVPEQDPEQEPEQDPEQVPEPATMALMVLGFGVLGAAGYRRRSLKA